MATAKMKPLVQKPELPLHPFTGFRNFLLAVLRNRVLLVVVGLALLALSLQWLSTPLILPPSFYLGLAFAGFGWAAFQAYKDLSQAYRKLLIPKPVEKIARAELSITFLSGNPYAYAIADPYAGQNHHFTKLLQTRGVNCRFDGRGRFYINDKVFYRMSKASLVLNIRMENTGDLPLEVTALHLENNLDLNYLKLSKSEVTLHGKKLSLPLPLQCGEFVLLQAKYEISASKDSNNELFAADFQALPRSIVHELSFDTQALPDTRQTTLAKIETLSKPLLDLYVKQWCEYDQAEYLFFAGQESPPPNAQTKNANPS